MTDRIDATAVLVLARAQGQAWVDDEVAQRIAAAATTAVAAVAASLPDSSAELLAAGPAEFAAMLDALAGPAS